MVSTLFWANAVSGPSTVVKTPLVCATAMGFLAHDWPMASNQVGFCCGNTSRTVNKHVFVVFPALILDFLTFNKILVVPSHVTCLIPSPGGVGLGVYLFKKETIRNPVSWSWMEVWCEVQTNSKDCGFLNLESLTHSWRFTSYQTEFQVLVVFHSFSKCSNGKLEGTVELYPQGSFAKVELSS